MIVAVLAGIAQALYALFLVAVGGWGIFFLDWELARLYALTGAEMQGVAGATLRNQFRFLKAIELTFGLFSLLYRREILSGGLACTLFLTGVGLGAFARALSWALDGRPAGAFLLFLALELVVFALVWLNARRNALQP